MGRSDTSERCAKELGGSGSLVIAPDIVGDAHTTGDKPFAIGTISDSPNGARDERPELATSKTALTMSIT